MKQNYFFLLLLLPMLLIGQTPFTSSTTPDLSAYGETVNYPGQGEYQIFLDTDNGIFDKPIVLLDGFDITDTRDINGIYTLLDFDSTSGNQNLLDLLRAEGFDIVILNFPEYTRAADGADIDGGTDFIERNAMLMVDLMEIVNSTKIGDEENVVIGLSTGGLISRYALNYMEENALNAETRLWISFDAPHHGFNVPIGLQHQLNFLAFNDFEPVPEVQPTINEFFDTPLSKQLMIDHYKSHILDGTDVEFDPLITLPMQDSFKTTFESNINTMANNGYPTNIRNVAIVNGSGTGSPYFAVGNSGETVSSGFTVVNTSLVVPSDFGDIDIDLNLNFTPSAGNVGNVSTIVVDPPFFNTITEAADSEAFLGVDGVDAASGGLFALSNLTDNITTTDPLTMDFLTAFQIDKFSFVPTVSALGIETTNGIPIDWYQQLNLEDNSATIDTAFDNTYLPNENEPHMQFTQANATFAMMEIMNPALSVDDNTPNIFQLEKNPVNNELILLSNNNSKANISISDLSGKVVFQTTEILKTRNIISVNLASGFYILNVSTENNETYTAKFLKN